MTKQPPIAKADLQKTQGNRAPAAAKNDDVISRINKPSMKAILAAALPRHMTPERMIRIATTEIRKVPELGECDSMSFVSAIVQCSQLGLEPGSALGHAYLLPFGNGEAESGKKNVQLIIGYRGMIDLARRSGQITSLSARVVREGDEFSFEFGLDEKLIHRPGENEDAPITHAYAVAKLKDGGVQFEVMTRKQIDRIRDTHSKAAISAAKKKKEFHLDRSLRRHGQKNSDTKTVQVFASIHRNPARGIDG